MLESLEYSYTSLLGMLQMQPLTTLCPEHFSQGWAVHQSLKDEVMTVFKTKNRFPSLLQNCKFS
jgi:hypothetical protein